MVTNDLCRLDLLKWQIPDEVWGRCQAILNVCDPPRRVGRRRIAPRQALSGVLYYLHTGCCWNRLPRQFGDDSSVHRTYGRWKATGAWPLMAKVLTEAGLLPQAEAEAGIVEADIAPAPVDAK